MPKPPLMNVKRMKSFLKGSPLDAIVAMSLENFRYIAGVSMEIQRFIKERVALVVWPRDGEPTMLIRNAQLSRVRDETWVEDIRLYREFEESPMRVLADILAEKSVGGGRIGVEKYYFCAQYYDELRSCLPDAMFEDCGPLLNEVKMVKTPGEIEVLSKACERTEKAIQIGFALSRPSETTRRIASLMAQALTYHGAEIITHLVLGSGRKSLQLNPIPDDTPIM